MFFRNLNNASLGHRLGLGLGAGLVVMFLLQTAAIWQIAARLVEQNVLGNLEHESETLLSMTNFAGQTLQLNAPLHALQYHRPFSGHYYQIRSDNDTVGLRSRSLWDANLPLNGLKTGESDHLYVKLFDQSLLVLNQVYERDGKRIRISVAEEVNHQNILVDRLMLGFGVVFALAMLLLWLWQQWSLRRAMFILQVTRQDMEDIWEGRRESLPVSQTPSEIQPVVEAFNHMLERLQHRMQRTRSALGDLAHSLKTPLARIHQILDSPLDETAKQELRQASEQIQQRIERELRIAQLAGIKSALGRIRLHQEAQDLIDAMTTLYPDKKLSLDCPKRLCLMADREDIIELLGNLIDNACKWAESQVAVNIHYMDGALNIRVEDDGCGMPDDALPALQQRGVRLDEQVAGHGLGLAIVAAVIREYNGQWRCCHSPLWGGACVEVSLLLSECHLCNRCSSKPPSS